MSYVIYRLEYEMPEVKIYKSNSLTILKTIFSFNNTLIQILNLLSDQIFKLLRAFALLKKCFLALKLLICTTV